MRTSHWMFWPKFPVKYGASRSLRRRVQVVGRAVARSAAGRRIDRPLVERRSKPSTKKKLSIASRFARMFALRQDAAHLRAVDIADQVERDVAVRLRRRPPWRLKLPAAGMNFQDQIRSLAHAGRRRNWRCWSASPAQCKLNSLTQPSMPRRGASAVSRHRRILIAGTGSGSVCAAAGGRMPTATRSRPAGVQAGFAPVPSGAMHSRALAAKRMLEFRSPPQRACDAVRTVIVASDHPDCDTRFSSVNTTGQFSTVASASATVPCGVSSAAITMMTWPIWQRAPAIRRHRAAAAYRTARCGAGRRPQAARPDGSCRRWPATRLT